MAFSEHPNQVSAANPATFPSISAKKIVTTWLARQRRRAEITDQLICQPDSVLEDFGFTRSELADEASKPFWMA